MILFLTLAALAADLGELPPQKLPEGQCATFFWARTEPPKRVAMLDGRDASLVLYPDGKREVLPEVAPGRYADSNLTATLDLGSESNTEGGRIIREGALRLDRPDGSSTILSVGGLYGCR